jgi:hypothetical protein
MASTSQKLNYGVTDSKVGQDQATGKVHNVPKRLPVSVVSIDKTNSIITLKFETDGMPYTLPNVTVPLSGPEYIRYPIKPQTMQQGGQSGGGGSGGQGQGQGQMMPGDFGFVTSADSNIGNMSGLGPNTPANFTLPANLSPLIFTLMGNKDWTPHDDQTALMGYAPTGTIHRDTNKKSKHIVHPTNGITSQTGAQDKTGPTSNPTYNIQHLLHPLNGLLALMKDKDNGDHSLSIVPKGGSGVIGMLLSVFGGKHKHQIDNSGHTITTSAKVNIEAVEHNINALTNISKLLKTASIAQLTNYIKF